MLDFFNYIEEEEEKKIGTRIYPFNKIKKTKPTKKKKII